MKTSCHPLILKLARVALVLSAAPLAVLAQTPLPTAFLYQGKLNDAGQPAAGLHEFEFALFGAEAGGTALGTLNKADIAVTGGIFHIDLDFGAGAFAGQARWLEIRVRRSDSSFPLTTLTPRQPLLPAPHAMFAARAGTVPDGSITQSKIATGNVANAALAEQAVTGNKIADGTIEGYKLTTGAVAASQLADGSVTEPKLAANAVTTNKLANASVTAEKLAPGIIGPQQLTKSYRSGSVALSDLPNDMVPRFAVTFATPMSAGPIVVTGLRDSSSEDVAGGLVQLTDTSPAGFVARALLPGSYNQETVAEAEASTVGDGLAYEEVNGRAAVLYSNDNTVAAPAIHRVTYRGRTVGGAITYATLDSDFLARECALSTKNGMAIAAYLGADTPDSPGTQRLRYAQASNADSDIWTIVSTFANANAAGWSGLSLHDVGGRPAIAYLDYSLPTFTVRYRRAGVDLSTWPAAVSLASGLDIPAVSNFLVVNGRPAIAWVQSGRLRYSRAADATGTAWQPSVVLSTAGAEGALVMAVIGGRPAVAYHYNASTHYTRALDADGTAWPVDGTQVSLNSLESLSLMEDYTGRPNIGGSNPDYFPDRNIQLFTSEADDHPWSRWTILQRPNASSRGVVFGKYGTGFNASATCFYYTQSADGRRRAGQLYPGYSPGSITWIAVEP